MMSVNWFSVLLSQAWSLPQLIACVLGLVACLVYLPRCPRAATCGLIAFVLLLFSVVSGVAVQVWLVGAGRGSLSSASTGYLLQGFALIRSLISAAALVLLTFAVFTDRAPPALPSGPYK